MLDVLFVRRPDVIPAIIELIPTYGYWRDLWTMYDRVWIQDDTNGKAVRMAINALVKRQFDADLLATHPSLLAKWLPREKSARRALARRFAGILFGHMEGATDDEKLATYRKAVAGLNKKLATVEIAMCGAGWSGIKPGAVPGRCLTKNRKAFLLQHKRAKLVQHLEDRLACRAKFLEHMSSGKAVKGADVVMPHEIISSVMHATEEEATILEAQWLSIRAAAAAGGGLRRVVPMCDFSGSMGGTPMMVSLALGILVSEIATPAFKDYILTFDSTPKWVSFKDCANLREKISAATEYGHGLSTDFQAACDLVLKRLVEYAVPSDEAPEDLLVFTDMGFDAACAAGVRSVYTGNSYGHVVKSGDWQTGSDQSSDRSAPQGSLWQTHCEMIRTSFAAAGYKAPRIIIWNLRAEYKDYHAKADDEGVLLLSGWSPALLKVIQGEGITVVTPYEALRKVLDDSRYDAIRAVFA
jgi:hypothetical protein